MRVKKRINKNDNENFCERFERDRELLQQERCKTFKKQNNYSNRRRNKHLHQSHEEKIT